MNRAKRLEILARFKAADPHPTTELNYATPYHLLVAVILSAQATDKSVNKATHELFRVVKSPTDMVKLGETGLKKHIRSIGLFNSKAKNIIATSRKLITDHNARVPATHEALTALPGVGRKTANVVLNTAFGQPTIAVDTHIFRVANRTKLGPGKTPLEVERKLVKYTPDEFRLDVHHWLILHGRYVCKARKPACPDCLINDLCEYRHKTPAAAA